MRGRQIRVTFIDAATNQSFAATDLAADDLPESFDLETTLRLGRDDWSVVEATPVTRAEAVKSGSLTLRLRRLESIDPQSILYSLPTICDFIPGLGSELVTGNESVLAEDDWRQVEFIDGRLALEADSEIAATRRIHETAWSNPGWREIHVRRGLASPLSGTFTLDDLSRVLGPGAMVGGVTYHSAVTRIESGFSLTTTDGARCYGLTDERRIRVFAIDRQPATPRSPSALALKTLAATFGLHLVNWCRCQRTGPDDPSFLEVLAGNR